MTDEISGRPPKPEDLFWKNAMLEMAKGSISSIEGSAKHLILAASFLEGVYFHALSFADQDILSGAAENTTQHWLLAIIFSAPVLLWLIVLGCAAMVLATKPYTVHPDDPEDAKQIFVRIADTKQRWLTGGLRVLMVSFAVLFLDVFIFLGAR